MAAVDKASIAEEVLRQALPPEEEHGFKLIDPGNYIPNSALPDLLLALPLTKSTGNQGAKEPIDIVWTELPPRRMNGRRKREGKREGRAEATHPQPHSSSLDILNKPMDGGADIQPSMLFCFFFFL